MFWLPLASQVVQPRNPNAICSYCNTLMWQGSFCRCMGTCEPLSVPVTNPPPQSSRASDLNPPAEYVRVMREIQTRVSLLDNPIQGATPMVVDSDPVPETKAADSTSTPMEISD